MASADKSDALSEYRKRVPKHKKADYQLVVSEMAEAFEKQQQKGMSILSVVQKKGQRVSDFKADFERAVRAAYPGGADEQTSGVSNPNLY